MPYLLATIGADTAENEQHFAEIWPNTDNYPTGPVRSRQGGRGRLDFSAPSKFELLFPVDPQHPALKNTMPQLKRRMKQ